MAVSESIKDLTAALAKAQIAFKPIKKTEKVDYQTTSGRKKYNYAPLSEVIEATKQALCDNGLCVIQTTKLVEGSVLLETLLSHSSGEWKSGELYVGKQDQPPQSEGSALTYKRRYGLSAILNVSSEEDDDAEGTKSTEEMTEGTVSSATAERRTVDKSEHYCEVHGVNFFMKGKMKSHAHPIGDTGEWCHEHLSKEKVDKRGEFEKECRNLVDEAMTGVKPHSLAVTTKSEPPPEESKEVEQEDAEHALVIDMDKLKIDLDTLDWVTCGKWLNAHFKVTGRRISDIVKKLTPDQQREFATEVEKRLEMS